MDEHLTQATGAADVIKPRSAGAVVYRRGEHGVRLLVLRAFAHWDFPKGLVEDGESELITARREVWEETGIGEIKFAFGEDYRETLPYSGGKIARYYLAETQVEKITLPVSPELGKPEHHEWRWVSLEEAEDLLPPRLAVVLEWVRGLLTKT